MASQATKHICYPTNMNFSLYKLETDEFQLLAMIVNEFLSLRMVLVGVAHSLFKGAYYSAQNMRQCVV